MSKQNLIIILAVLAIVAVVIVVFFQKPAAPDTSAKDFADATEAGHAAENQQILDQSKDVIALNGCRNSCKQKHCPFGFASIGCKKAGPCIDGCLRQFDPSSLPPITYTGVVPVKTR